MRLKLAAPIFIIAAISYAQAQQGAQPPSAAKPSKDEIQKVIQLVSSDKSKTQQYCEIGRLNQAIAAAHEKGDNAKVEALSKQADDLVHKIGPEFVKFVDALDEIEDDAAGNEDLVAAVKTLDNLCTEKK